VLDAAELEELRSLQARAYARDSSLTGADAARLRELEERRVARPIAPRGEASPVDAVTSSASEAAGRSPVDLPDTGTERQGTHAAEVSDAETSLAAGTAADDAASHDIAPRVLPLLRVHWRAAAIAVAVLLVVGVGCGWMLFGRSGTASVALTAQQQEWQSALIAGGRYDQGSLRALAVEQGAVIWAATKDDGESTCLLVATSPSALPTCERTETVERTGLFGAVTLESKDEIRRELNVQLMFAPSGEPAVAVHTSEYGPGTTNGVIYENAEEAEKAKRIAGQGFEINSLWVIGYDGEVPVWTGMELEGFQTCLIYDGSNDRFPRVCADALTMQEQGATLVLNVLDDASGELVRLELPTASNGNSSLTIRREGGAGRAGGG